MTKTAPLDCSYEAYYWDRGIAVVGLDEVGRGPLAGPATVGAVCISHPTSSLEKEWLTCGIHDSKKLSAQKREKLEPFIRENAAACSVVSSTVEEINALGIVKAIQKAAVLALLEIRQKIEPSIPLFLLSDAFEIPGIEAKGYVGQMGIIKGDAKVLSIAAASVIAKVVRDSYMDELSLQFPHYLWAQNKGYGTAAHLASIREYGPCPAHRTLFIRSVLQSGSVTVR